MDDNQIQPPPSFVALYASPSGHRLLQPMGHVRERYELCEDLAQALTEQAATAQFKTGAREAQVLESIRTGLAGADSAVSTDEAQWVTRRLAELLGWPMPGDAAPA
jgi:hypothetical protein